MEAVPDDNSNPGTGMQIKSSVFADQKDIPKKYTGEGADVSPPLSFEDIPKQAQSLALVVDDPDAPRGTFDHWVAWNIPSTLTGLSEGAKVPKQGTNHFNDRKYRGPMPPPGKPHRYFFKLYALDCTLTLPEGASKEELEDAMQGHIVAQAQLIGTYKR